MVNAKSEPGRSALGSRFFFIILIDPYYIIRIIFKYLIWLISTQSADGLMFIRSVLFSPITLFYSGKCQRENVKSRPQKQVAQRMKEEWLLHQFTSFIRQIHDGPQPAGYQQLKAPQQYL